MEEQLYVFEVETEYKSGRRRHDVVVCESEEKLWKWHSLHRDKRKMVSAEIVDVWKY